MDTVSIFIGVFVMVAFMSIFMLPSIQTKKRQKRMLATLKSIAEKHNSMIVKTELIGDVMLGVDEGEDLIYYYKTLKEGDVSSVIHAKDLISCKLIQKMKSSKSSNANFNPYEKISFELILKDRSNTHVDWVFYDVDQMTQLNFDVKLLEKWEKLINKTIKFTQ